MEKKEESTSSFRIVSLFRNAFHFGYTPRRRIPLRLVCLSTILTFDRALLHALNRFSRRNIWFHCESPRTWTTIPSLVDDSPFFLSVTVPPTFLFALLRQELQEILQTGNLYTVRFRRVVLYLSSSNSHSNPCLSSLPKIPRRTSDPIEFFCVLFAIFPSNLCILRLYRPKIPKKN